MGLACHGISSSPFSGGEHHPGRQCCDRCCYHMLPDLQARCVFQTTYFTNHCLPVSEKTPIPNMSTGASIEDLQITYTSDQLHQCYTTLSNSVQANQTHTSLPSGIDLKSLSEECCKSADILHKELKALQKSGGRGSLKASTYCQTPICPFRTLSFVRFLLDSFGRVTCIKIQRFTEGGNTDSRHDSREFRPKEAQGWRNPKT